MQVTEKPMRRLTEEGKKRKALLLPMGVSWREGTGKGSKPNPKNTQREW
jgi:hypothetical protein